MPVDLRDKGHESSQTTVGDAISGAAQNLKVRWPTPLSFGKQVEGGAVSEKGAVVGRAATI